MGHPNISKAQLDREAQPKREVRVSVRPGEPPRSFAIPANAIAVTMNQEGVCHYYSMLQIEGPHGGRWYMDATAFVRVESPRRFDWKNSLLLLAAEHTIKTRPSTPQSGVAIPIPSIDGPMPFIHF